MWLIGKINIDNTLRDSEGIVGTTKLVFDLPRKLRRRHKVKVRYFGFHSGVSGDNLDITQQTDSAKRTFRSEEDNNNRQRYYQFRHFPSELRMEVKVDGMNISHDNVGTMTRGDGSVENVEYIRYPTTKVSSSMMHTNDTFALENSLNRPLPHGHGASEMQDFGLGYVDTTTSRIEVCLNAAGYEIKNNPNFSNEPNVRMDTITVVLQLL